MIALEAQALADKVPYAVVRRYEPVYHITNLGPDSGKFSLENISNDSDRQPHSISQLHPHARILLGKAGQERFDMFWNETEGWYFGSAGKVLSRDAVKYFNRFCSLIENISEPVSIFMGIEGNLEISWLNKEGYSIEVEFFSDRIEFFFEKTEEERTVEPNEIKQLVADIMSL